MPGGALWATAVRFATLEAEIHRPVRQFLEAQGYEVTGEAGSGHVVGVRAEGERVVVELDERLTLALVLRAVDRLSFSDAVYVAFRGAQGNTAWQNREETVLALLRRLGLGLLTVSASGEVVPILDPPG